MENDKQIIVKLLLCVSVFFASAALLELLASHSHAAVLDALIAVYSFFLSRREHD